MFNEFQFRSPQDTAEALRRLVSYDLQASAASPEVARFAREIDDAYGLEGLRGESAAKYLARRDLKPIVGKGWDPSSLSDGFGMVDGPRVIRIGRAIVVIPMAKDDGGKRKDRTATERWNDFVDAVEEFWNEHKPGWAPALNLSWARIRPGMGPRIRLSKKWGVLLGLLLLALAVGFVVHEIAVAVSGLISDLEAQPLALAGGSSERNPDAPKRMPMESQSQVVWSEPSLRQTEQRIQSSVKREEQRPATFESPKRIVGSKPNPNPIAEQQHAPSTPSGKRKTATAISKADRLKSAREKVLAEIRRREALRDASIWRDIVIDTLVEFTSGKKLEELSAPLVALEMGYPEIAREMGLEIAKDIAVDAAFDAATAGIFRKGKMATRGLTDVLPVVIGAVGGKKRKRFKKAKDAAEQLTSIAKAQERVRRKGEPGKIIDSIEKSTQRERNANKRIKSHKDALEEYDENTPIPGDAEDE